MSNPQKVTLLEMQAFFMEKTQPFRMACILLHASSLKEAYLLGSRLLMNAILKGWIFSTKKACISNRVTFCGLDLKANSNQKVSVLPEINRIHALTELPAPSTRKEAQSLIGLLVSFSKWVLGLTKMMLNISN